MFRWLPLSVRIWIDNQLSPMRRAEREAIARLDTQRVHAIRETKDSLRRTATLNGLRAVAAPEVRERFDAVMGRKAAT